MGPGSPEQLLATIRNAMEDLLQGVTLVLELTERLTTGRARFPERLHITALHARHGIATMWLRYDFLRWAEEWVRTWQGTGPEGKEAEAEAILHEARTRLEDLDRELRDSLSREQAHGQTQG